VFVGGQMSGDGRPEAAAAAVADNWAAGPASSSRLQRSLVVAAEAKTPATAGPRQSVVGNADLTDV